MIFTTCILLLAAAGLGHAAPSTGVAPPEGFKITSLGVNGSGCPPGSAVSVLSADRSAVTISFSQYQASAGPSVPRTENRKNCFISLGLHVPGGYSFSINTVDYRGFYSLDQGVTATQSAAYYFQGKLQQADAHSTQVGPVAGQNYVYRDQFNVATLVNSPCGKDTVVNINTALLVDNHQNPSGSGFITDDSVDAHFHQIYGFQWQKC